MTDNNVLTLKNNSSSEVTFYVTGSDGHTEALTLESMESVAKPLGWTGTAGLISGMINGPDANQVLSALPLRNANATISVIDGVVWQRDTVSSSATLSAKAEIGAPGVFAIQKQLLPNWCWAAVTSSVGDFYGVGQKSQGQLANDCLKQTTCTNTPPGIGCDAPFDTAEALRSVSHLNAVTPGPLLQTSVASEIAGKHPVGLGIYWPTSKVGHAIVISAYAGAGDTASITVQDPAHATVSSVAFKGFPGNAYPNASWSRTFTTK